MDGAPNGKKTPWVVILGAGFGGLTVAWELEQFLERNPGVLQVALIDRNHSLVIETANQFVLAGRTRVEQVTSAYQDLKLKSVFFVQDEILSIDRERKTVFCKGHKFKYDYLVVALGSSPDTQRIAGLEQGCFDVSSIQSVMQLKDALADFQGGTVLLAVSPGDFANTLWVYQYAFLLQNMLSKDENIAKATSIIVTTSEKRVAPSEAADQVMALLNARGIQVKLNARVVFVDPVKRAAIYADGSKVKYDILISQLPRKAPAVLVDSRLAPEGRFVPSDSRTSKTPFPCIYCLGDCADMRMPFDNKSPFPKGGAFAMNQGVIVAEDIRTRLNAADPYAWNPSSGAHQVNSTFIAVETGNSEAVRVTFDLFSDAYSGSVSVSQPTKEHMKALVSWWDELVVKWFKVHDEKPKEKKKK